MKQIFIIEDEIVVAKSIEEILIHNGYNVIDIATSYQQAKQKFLTINPDLILCDINLNSDKTGIDLMKEIKIKYSIPFIFITAHSDIAILKEAIKVSPYAYITKPFNEKQLITSVNGILAAIENKEATTPTDKELLILQLIAQGYITKQIADKLSISYHTVETHRKNLMNKYGVKSMPELVCFATHKGWIEYKKQ